MSGEPERKEKAVNYNPLKYQEELEAELAELKKKLAEQSADRARGFDSLTKEIILNHSPEKEDQRPLVSMQAQAVEDFLCNYFNRQNGKGSVAASPPSPPHEAQASPTREERLAKRPPHEVQAPPTREERLAKRVTRQRRELARLSKRLAAFHAAANHNRARELNELTKEIILSHDRQLRESVLAALERIINNAGRKEMAGGAAQILQDARDIFVASSSALDRALYLLGEEVA